MHKNEIKLFVGPMSLNVVDAVIEYAEETKIPLGLIPSRRQVDYTSGYVNGWVTHSLANYVRSKTNRVLLVRDHGGQSQGESFDYGWDSFYCDSQNLDLIHIDPWRCGVLDLACQKTAEFIHFCHKINPKVQFEVGTEEAIFPYQAKDLDYLLTYLRDNLKKKECEKIRFAVIQSGTGLKNGINIGAYDADRLNKMLDVCKKFGLSSKEHNGDYLTPELIKSKFEKGLSSINIAPEFGQMETKILLGELNQEETDLFYKVCYESGKWKKWTNKVLSKEETIILSGHYVFSHPEIQALKAKFNLDNKVKTTIKERIDNIVGK